jgi:hypothetical protein
MFVFVTSALALTLKSQYTTFNVHTFSVQEAKAVKNKTPSSALHQAPSSNDGNTIIRTSSSSQSNPASPGCINYNPSTRTITVSCSGPTSLTDIDNKLKDTTVLAKQSPNGIWYLRANMVIAKGATFNIDSTDTRWLKISSEQAIAGDSRHTSALPYYRCTW